jgi:hypothetical protein
LFYLFQGKQHVCNFISTGMHQLRNRRTVFWQDNAILKGKIGHGTALGFPTKLKFRLSTKLPKVIGILISISSVGIKILISNRNRSFDFFPWKMLQNFDNDIVFRYWNQNSDVGIEILKSEMKSEFRCRNRNSKAKIESKYRNQKSDVEMEIPIRNPNRKSESDFCKT